MNARERVLRAFKRIPGMPDRIPVQFDLCRSLQEHFAKELGIESRYTNHPYEDIIYRISGNEIKLALGCDVVVTGMSEAADFVPKKNEDGTWINEYGMTMREGEIYVEVAKYALADAMTAEDIENYNLPDATDPSRYKDAEYYVNKYKNDYVVIGDIEVSVLTIAQQLVGIEKLLMDMALEEEYVQPLFEKCAKFITDMGVELIRRGVDALWLGDDFGSQQNLLFSPAIFRSQLKDHFVKMINTFKAENKDIIICMHTDGAVKALLPDLKEMGIEVFNPVQPGVPGHSPQELKDEFGDDFVFWGAIDQQYLLPRGTDEEVEADIKEKCEILGKGGGYMISPAHILQSDVSPERVKFFIETCKKYSEYK